MGEAPGRREDEKGKPWQGKVGRLLQKTYRRLGVDLFQDCVNINSIACRPPKNRDPSAHELACCHNKMIRPTLEKERPKVVVLLGNAAIQSVIGLRAKNDLGGITRWRGWVIPDRHWNAWLCPVFHPSFVEREDSEAAMTIWEQDLERAFDAVNRPLTEYEEDTRYVTVVEGGDEIAGLLRRINDSGETIAFDYETTGLKPQAEGHRIVSASIATGADEAYSFVMPGTGTARSAFKRLLGNENVSKVAANLKFEQNWSAVCLGVEVRGWDWDTMQAAHILDNRPGITGLDFQVYVNFGVLDYSSHIKPYLQGTDASGNAFNRIDELMADPRGRRELLVYGGLDSLYEYRLAEIQKAGLPPF